MATTLTTMFPKSDAANGQPAAGGEAHHQHQHGNGDKKKCNSASCNSPSRLWRSIQLLIADKNKQDLIKLCHQDGASSTDAVLQVILRSRLANDASYYPASHRHRVLQLPQGSVSSHGTLGRSVADLNALQLAMFHGQEAIACYFVSWVGQHGSKNEVNLFLNHLWGQRNNSLHLACFLGMPRLAKLLLDAGVPADSVNGKLKTPLDCCTEDACRALFTLAPATSAVPAPPAMAPLVKRKATRPMSPAPAPAPATEADDWFTPRASNKIMNVTPAKMPMPVMAPEAPMPINRGGASQDQLDWSASFSALFDASDPVLADSLVAPGADTQQDWTDALDLLFDVPDVVHVVDDVWTPCLAHMFSTKSPHTADFWWAPCLQHLFALPVSRHGPSKTDMALDDANWTPNLDRLFALVDETPDDPVRCVNVDEKSRLDLLAVDDDDDDDNDWCSSALMPLLGWSDDRNMKVNVPIKHPDRAADGENDDDDDGIHCWVPNLALLFAGPGGTTDALYGSAPDDFSKDNAIDRGIPKDVGQFALPMVRSVQGGTADGDGTTKLAGRGVNDGGNPCHSLGTAANAPPGASCALTDRGRTPILNDADGSTATPADHDASGNATRTQATPLKPDAIWDHPSELHPKSMTPCGPDDAGDTLTCPDQQGAADPGAPTGKTSRASRRSGNKDPGVVSAPNWTDPATPTAINDHGSGGTPPLLVKDNDPCDTPTTPFNDGDAVDSGGFKSIGHRVDASDTSTRDDQGVSRVDQADTGDTRSKRASNVKRRPSARTRSPHRTKSRSKASSYQDVPWSSDMIIASTPRPSNRPPNGPKDGTPATSTTRFGRNDDGSGGNSRATHPTRSLADLGPVWPTASASQQPATPPRVTTWWSGPTPGGTSDQSLGNPKVMAQFPPNLRAGRTEMTSRQRVAPFTQWSPTWTIPLIACVGNT